jgi:hypothetical protein
VDCDWQCDKNFKDECKNPCIHSPFIARNGWEMKRCGDVQRAFTSHTMHYSSNPKIYILKTLGRFDL